MMSTELLTMLKAYSVQARKFDDHADFFSAVSVEISVDQSQSRITANGIDDKSTIPVLVHFRPFYMKQSSLNFIKVTETILNDESTEKFWQTAESFETAWIKYLDPSNKSFGGLSLGVNASLFNLKKHFDIWMNQGYLHPEDYKSGSSKGLDALKQLPEFDPEQKNLR